MITLRRRRVVGWQHTLYSVLAAIVLTFVISLIVLWFNAKQPLEALWQLSTYPYQGGTVWVQWAKALNTAAYLGVIALGLSVGYRANVWNIGAEGQFAFGAIGALGTWMIFGQPDTLWFMPILLLGGAAGGMLYAAIPAALRAFANVNELLTSLMLVYVSANFMFYLSNGPWTGPVKHSPPRSHELPDILQLPALVPEASKLHWGLVIAAVVFVVVSLVILFSVLGYRLSVAQNTPRAERFAGFSPKSTVWVAFMLSGGLAGLMGGIYLSADIGYLTESSNFLRNFGFSAIIIAFLGRLHPIGILFAALFIGYVNGGATWIQANLREDDSIAGFIEVIALFSTLGTALFVQYELVPTNKKGGDE